jgi:hypothetical protein
VAKSTTPFKEVDFNLVAIHIINGGKENIPNDVPKNIRNIIEKC